MLRGATGGVTVATMAPRTKASRAPTRRKAPADEPAERPVDRDRLVIRGLTADDLEALARATESTNARIREVSPGASTSRNGVALGLLREALRPYRSTP